MRTIRWLLTSLTLIGSLAAFVVAPGRAEAATASAFLLGDSVLASIDNSPTATAALARHDVLLDGKVCRRLITTSCSSAGVTPNTALESLTAAEGTFQDILVVEAGYNDSSIGTAVDRIIGETRRQGIGIVVWLTYHEGGANAATYAQHNETLRAKAGAYPELRVVDFNTYAHAHPEWFASDGLHLKTAGALGLAELIADSLDAVVTGDRCSVSRVSASPGAAAPTSVVGGLHALAQPVRLADTRRFLLPVGRNRLLGVQITGKAGVPAEATAALVTATAVSPCGLAYLTVFPCGSTPPDASAVNAPGGATVANAAVVRLSATGALCVFANTSTDVLVDVAAWIGPDGLGTTPVVPARLVDTRRAAGQRLDTPQQRLRAGKVLTVPVGLDPLAAGAVIVSVNLTAVDPGAAGYLTVFPGPCSAPPPNASNVNVAARRTAAAAATTTVGADGSICVYSSVDTDVIIDLNGAGTTTGGAQLQPVAPRRLTDTRPTRARVAPGGDVIVDFDDPTVGAPTNATGFVVNLTAVGPAGDGYVTVAPCQADGGLPYVSNLNTSTDVTAANLVVVAAGEGRRVCFRPSVTTDLVIDVEAWIVPPV